MWTLADRGQNRNTHITSGENRIKLCSVGESPLKNKRRNTGNK